MTIKMKVEEFLAGYGEYSVQATQWEADLETVWWKTKLYHPGGSGSPYNIIYVATPSHDVSHLEWSLISDLDIIGFNVYDSRGERLIEMEG